MLVFFNGKLSRYRADTSRKDSKISQHSRLQEGRGEGTCIQREPEEQCNNNNK